MMKHEFEALAGYEVSIEDYEKIIEPMYMATDLNKEEFVKTINKKRFALKPLKDIIKAMKKEAEHMKDVCEHYTDYDSQDRLYALVEEYLERRGLKGIASYMVETTQFHSCYYPSSVSIYGKKTYKNIEEIQLV